jgi:hypothetical protein
VPTIAVSPTPWPAQPPGYTTTPTTTDPAPISAALKRHFDDELSQIQSGKSIRVGGALTTAGAQVGVGFRRGTWTAAVYAGREWSSGWLAGGQVAWSR